VYGKKHEMVTLAILGILFVVAAVRPLWIAKPVLSIAGLVPAIDTVVLCLFVGVFIGTVLLCLATVMFFGGIVLRPSLRHRPEGQ
jgi:hypothetical protein